MLIPAGMTPECQPLDISVNKVFKNNIKQSPQVTPLPPCVNYLKIQTEKIG